MKTNTCESVHLGTSKQFDDKFATKCDEEHIGYVMATEMSSIIFWDRIDYSSGHSINGDSEEVVLCSEK